MKALACIPLPIVFHGGDVYFRAGEQLLRWEKEAALLCSAHSNAPRWRTLLAGWLGFGPVHLVITVEQLEAWEELP